MIGVLLNNKTDNVLTQFFRYIFVGGAVFVVDFALLFVLTEYLYIYYLISAAIAFIVGVAINYILSIVWVFNRRQLSNKTFEFGVFALIGIVGLGLNELFIWLFTESFHFHYLVSKIFSAGFVFMWNFFSRKRLLF